MVFVGSYGASHVLSNSVSYCAAKAGLDMMARALAWDLRFTAFRCYCVHPYHVEGTPMASQVEQEIMHTKKITRQQAVEYQRKDLGATPPLVADDVACFVARLLDNEGGEFNWLSPSIQMSGAVR